MAAAAAVAPFAPVVGRSHEVCDPPRPICLRQRDTQSLDDDGKPWKGADKSVEKIHRTRRSGRRSMRRRSASPLRRPPPARPFSHPLRCAEQEPRGQGAQASAGRRALVAGVSAVVCVAAVALLAAGGEGGRVRRGARAGPAELAAASSWMQKLQKTSAPKTNKMFLTAIDAAMAAVKDARGNISPQLAQTKKPVLKVLAPAAPASLWCPVRAVPGRPCAPELSSGG